MSSKDPKTLREHNAITETLGIQLKICGMKYPDNYAAVAALNPDYMGFIFYEKSPRNFEGTIPEIPSHIKKTGVFVNATIPLIIEKVKTYGFKAIQLHGNESAGYCKTLRERLVNSISINNPIELFKVFSIKAEFDFTKLKPYEGLVDYFLFDTKGPVKGGNGYTFDWTVLKEYTSKTPLILSGGIGLDEVSALQEIAKTTLPIHALDINSKFEDEPGRKNIKKLQQFIAQLSNKP